MLTADCLPVLFCDRDGTRVAAAHAGWRGLAGGVVESALRAMGVAPDRVLAWLGPAIEQDTFEVGPEVREQFVARSRTTRTRSNANARGRWQADLYDLARRELARLGVTQVYGGGFRCYADRDRFFSYRRDGNDRAHGDAASGLKSRTVRACSALDRSGSSLLGGALSALAASLFLVAPESVRSSRAAASGQLCDRRAARRRAARTAAACDRASRSLPARTASA